MCSGRVDLSFILRAFSKGIDGVFIGGCHLGECNYMTHGNYHALNTVLLAKRLMEHIGLHPDRLRIQFMSGAEANLFAESVNDFVHTVKGLGPLEAASGLASVTRLVPYIKITLQEKLASRDAEFTPEEIAGLLHHVVSYYIDPERCQACMTCARRCPADAIISAKGHIHVIDQEKCIKCGACLAACPPRFASVRKIAGDVPPPLPEAQRTIVRRQGERGEG